MMNATEPVIVDAIRTPFGKRKGALRHRRPDDLLASTLGALLDRNPVVRDQIDDLIAGCVSQAGEQAANVARLAALLSSLGPDVPGVTLNRMCGSSQQAMHFAAQAIAAGDAKFVIAAGVESMTRVPMFLDVTLGQHEFRGFEDLNPALMTRYGLVHQVESAERIADHWQISRTECDDYARESHARAHAAQAQGMAPGAIAADGHSSDDAPISLHHDEGVRPVVDAARIASMNPVFRSPGEGVVTAANASQMSDGASAVLVANHQAALDCGLRPRARFRARVVCGSDPVMQLTGVIPATHRALARAGVTLDDIDWIEINEAFATVVLAWAREFAPDMSRVNPWGGAIAHGHPLGATGGALMAKMLAGLERHDGTLGLQVMCIGHGMATATIIERM